MLRRKVSWFGLILLLCGALLLPATASAHPLGNFSINQYSRLEVSTENVKIFYVLDLAEIPTFQDKELADTNGNGQLETTEQAAYLERKVTALQANLKLSLNDQNLPLSLSAKTIAFVEGQGGLPTTRIEAQFVSAKLPESTGLANLRYSDQNNPDRLGWRAIVARNSAGIAVAYSTALANDVSNELRVYPQDMLSNPPALSSVQLSFRFDPTAPASPLNSAATEANAIKPQDALGNLISGELSLSLLLLAFGTAFIFGMAHALSPGHGKTVVAAYLVGSRSTVRHSIFLGLTVTVTHTLGIFALGLLTLFASNFILPEKLYPWLGLLSGLLVLGLGLTLLRTRLKPVLTRNLAAEEHAHSDHSHEQPEHAHTHHNHTADHSHGHGHTEHHSHSHEEHSNFHHDASHTHENHTHSHAMQIHSHGGITHTHVPPGADNTPVTWKRLLLFGISAGLLPCPSALVIMLSAIALGRVALGLSLVVFFSLGLATTLTGLGLLFVFGRRWLTNFKLSAGRQLFISRAVPVFGAVVITVVGVVLSFQALQQTGLF